MKHIGKLFRDMVPVIIGILVALFINNWNEDRKDEAYLRRMFSAIEKEIEASIEDIEFVIPSQLASLDTINANLHNDDVSLYGIMMRSNGLHVPTIKTNAWEAIANSRIELIDYERLSILVDIQERKENLQLRIDRQMEFIFNNFENRDIAKKVILRMMTADIVSTEKEILAEMKKVLEDGTLSALD